MKKKTKRVELTEIRLLLCERAQPKKYIFMPN